MELRPRPVLTGRLVRLRPLVASDADAMFASLDDAETRRLTGTRGAFTLEQVRAWCAGLEAAEDRIDLAIVSREDVRGRGPGHGSLRSGDRRTHPRSSGRRVGDEGSNTLSAAAAARPLVRTVASVPDGREGAAATKRARDRGGPGRGACGWKRAQ
jgi:RimJ/RimL family protein N-acetyltransferase